MGLWGWAGLGPGGGACFRWGAGAVPFVGCGLGRGGLCGEYSAPWCHRWAVGECGEDAFLAWRWWALVGRGGGGGQGWCGPRGLGRGGLAIKPRLWAPGDGGPVAVAAAAARPGGGAQVRRSVWAQLGCRYQGERRAFVVWFWCCVRWPGWRGSGFGGPGPPGCRALGGVAARGLPKSWGVCSCRATTRVVCAAVPVGGLVAGVLSMPSPVVTVRGDLFGRDKGFGTGGGGVLGAYSAPSGRDTGQDRA